MMSHENQGLLFWNLLVQNLLIIIFAGLQLQYVTSKEIKLTIQFRRTFWQFTVAQPMSYYLNKIKQH